MWCELSRRLQSGHIGVVKQLHAPPRKVESDRVKESRSQLSVAYIDIHYVCARRKPARKDMWGTENVVALLGRVQNTVQQPEHEAVQSALWA